jgi:hypothetical protein
MARLPRFRWNTLFDKDQLLRWLILDGYGFHQAYFHTDKYVRQQYVERDFPWPVGAPHPYANRAIDQGIGRAMWFVCGTDPVRVADTFDRFPTSRRADLYSGSGLAATYAGGVTEDELRTYWERAGQYRPQVAQASAFAATARVQAGLVTPHTELATRVFCGVSPQEAADICANALPASVVDGEIPAYELWRQAIAQNFTAHVGAVR